jgi:acetyltransferase-like isoleucine patch superfamily enzyme
MTISRSKIRKYLRSVYAEISDYKPKPNNISFGENVGFPNNFSIENQNKKESVYINDNNTFSEGFHIRCFKNGHIEFGSYNWSSLRLQIVSAISVKIGSYCMFGRDVYISDTNEHPLDPDIRLDYTKKYWNDGWNVERYEGVANKEVVIEDNVWLGDRVFIMKGVRIGSGSVVAAGSVVLKSVEENTLVAGNPARFIKKLK